MSGSMTVCPAVPMDAGVDYNAAANCTSGKNYVSGTGPTMEPGLSCYNCHGTQFTIVGTVYPTAHEPDGCDGSNVKGASVVLTDAKNTKITLTPNTVGNFYSAQNIVMPFTAVVTYNGKSLAMTTPQMSADCNSCHTQAGDSCAPGRIVMP
jgi:cytochrome c553